MTFFLTSIVVLVPHYDSSQSTADLLTVASEEIVGVFSRSGTTRAVAPDISKAFDRVWHAVLLKLKSYEIFGHMFDLILSFFL